MEYAQPWYQQIKATIIIPSYWHICSPQHTFNVAVWNNPPCFYEDLAPDVDQSFVPPIRSSGSTACKTVVAMSVNIVVATLTNWVLNDYHQAKSSANCTHEMLIR